MKLQKLLVLALSLPLLASCGETDNLKEPEFKHYENEVAFEVFKTQLFAKEVASPVGSKLTSNIKLNELVSRSESEVVTRRYDDEVAEAHNTSMAYAYRTDDVFDITNKIYKEEANGIQTYTDNTPSRELSYSIKEDKLNVLLQPGSEEGKLDRVFLDYNAYNVSQVTYGDDFAEYATNYAYESLFSEINDQVEYYELGDDNLKAEFHLYQDGDTFTLHHQNVVVNTSYAGNGVTETDYYGVFQISFEGDKVSYLSKIHYDMHSTLKNTYTAWGVTYKAGDKVEETEHEVYQVELEKTSDTLSPVDVSGMKAIMGVPYVIGGL